MRTITVFYDQVNSYLYRWLKPLFYCKKEFLQHGYKIEYSSITDYLPMHKIIGSEKAQERVLNRLTKKNSDIVFLAFHHSSSHFCKCSIEERTSLLQKIKKNAKQVVWLDTADSTGTCMFDVLPYVDLYFKKQILKDLTIYTKPMWGGRIYCDFYHEKLGIDDPNITGISYPVLDIEYADKLRVSWNVGLGDLFTETSRQLYLHPFSRKTPLFISPNNNGKTLDLQYRGSSFSPIAGYQRQEAKRLVSKIDYISHSDCNKSIPYSEYIVEGRSAKAILSPFGWGEVCGRDFEAIVFGATLIKHSMEHCVTYPDIYRPNETYIPLEWDFSNFETVMRKVGCDKYKEIATNAQNLYKYYFSQEGRNEFVNHVIKQLTHERI